MRNRSFIALLIALVFCPSSFGTEPNETFATATVLAPGVTVVSDQLTLANFPDTVLGIRDHFGEVYFVDDDSSPLGDGTASGVCAACDNESVAPTNSGAIDFSVSGYPDDSFDGFHSESGQYQVFVNVYDFFDDLVDQFSEVHLLQPGVVHDFYYENFEWINGYYEVFIDNTVGLSDVDFFTYTGLSPGAAFTARTLDPDSSKIDTYLGWFDDAGAVLAVDDDSGGGPTGALSLIQGMVPSSGMLTFAVTGFGDDNFGGDHGEFGTYQLELQLAGATADYNGDGELNAADYVTWRRQAGTAGEYTAWRAQYGDSAPGLAGQASAVPEPASMMLFASCAIIGFTWRLRPNSSSGTQQIESP